jgi:circadian clock protein KaiC
VVLLDYESTPSGDRQLHSLTHGVVRLEQLTPGYGGERRRVRIQKLRGVKFRNGYHDMTIETGGLVVFPRLVAAEHHDGFSHGSSLSGVGPLDQLLGGGLDRGTSTLIMGPAGVGKSTLSAQYAVAAVKSGLRAAFYVFDEVPDTFAVRGEGLGMNIRELVDSGRISIHQVDPAELSPGEFAHRIRQQVEDGVGFVVIDSLNGYQNAMPEEHFLSAHLHELLAFLNQRGVITIIVMSQHGILGEGIQAPIEISYLADTVILLRYFEAQGEVRKAISVVKKRTGAHERTIRELSMGPGGLIVGEELRDFQGVLSGMLTYLGDGQPLMRSGGEYIGR